MNPRSADSLDENRYFGPLPPPRSSVARSLSGSIKPKRRSDRGVITRIYSCHSMPQSGRPLRHLSRILRCGSVDHPVSSAANPARCATGHGRRKCASALAVCSFGDVRRVGLLVLGSAVRLSGPRRSGFDARHGKPALRPPLHSLGRGGLAEIQYSCELDSGGYADRERRRSARRVAEGRNGADADHAKDIRRIARPPPSRRRRLQPARQHSRRRRATARRGSSPLTMQALPATTSIWRPADRCRQRRRSMSQCSRR